MAIETPTAADPNNQDASYGGAARMAGDYPDDGSGQSSSINGGEADPQAALAGIVQMIRSIDETLVGISEQFPQASQELRNARSAVQSVMKKIVSEPGGQPPAAPMSGGY